MGTETDLCKHKQNKIFSKTDIRTRYQTQRWCQFSPIRGLLKFESEFFVVQHYGPKTPNACFGSRECSSTVKCSWSILVYKGTFTGQDSKAPSATKCLSITQVGRLKTGEEKKKKEVSA